MHELKNLVQENLIASVKECFSVTLGMDLSFGDAALCVNSGNSLICSVGFTGKLEGSVTVIIVDKTACFVVGKMLGMELAELDSDVKDGFGELGNMIAGGLKTRLAVLGQTCNISIPTTIVGKNMEVFFPKNVTKVGNNFQADGIEFDVIVDFKVSAEEQSEPARVEKDKAIARLRALIQNIPKTE